jgi:hypothetical protein
VAKAWCGGTRGSGRSFYRRLGRGKGGEVASTGELATAVMMAHRGDGTARASGVKGRLGHSARGRMMPNRAGERVNGEATGRTVAGGECVDSLVTGEGEKGLTGGARLPERANARGEGQEWLAGGAGLTATWRERGRRRWVVLGLWAGDERAGERERGVGLNPAQPRGDFPFSFSISISIYL